MWVRDARSAVSVTTVTAGFHKAGLLQASPAPEHDESSDDSDSEAEEDASVMLPSEVVQLFDSIPEEDFE